MSVIFITTIDLNKSLIQRPHHMIRYLKEKKVDTTVLSISLGDESGRVEVKTDECINYITIPMKFLDTFNPNNIYTPYSRIDKKYYDVCISVGPWAGFVGIILKHAGKTGKLVYEDVDYFPAFFDYDMLYERVRQMEKICLNYYDLVFCVSQELMELRQYQTHTHLHYLPNGVDLELFDIKRTRTNHNTLIYSGAIEDWAGVEFVIRSMKALRDVHPDIKLLILGKGSKDKMLMQLIKDLSIEDIVEFKGVVKYEKLPEYFAQADIGIAMLRPTELIRYAFPLKVVEYMASGLPVIVTDIGDMGRIIKSNNAGIAINYSQKEFVDAVNRLIKESELYKKLSPNAKKTSKKYKWNCLFDEEFDIIGI